MLRKTTSFIMLFSFVIMVVSGIAEFISPFGRLAMMIKWKMLGIDKMQWQALHLSFMVVFTIAGLIHIWLNIKPIKAYLKNKARKMVFFTKEMFIALAITIILFVATIEKFEPIEHFVKLNKSFNSYWIEQFKKDRLR
jgi:succinate dehydrogenase hydrophobic anchor subunit